MSRISSLGCCLEWEKSAGSWGLQLDVTADFWGMAPVGVHKANWCWGQGEECQADPGKSARCPVGIFWTGKCPQHSVCSLPSVQALSCRDISVCTQGWQLGRIRGAASTETARFAFGVKYLVK